MLHTDAVLNGTLQSSGDRLRISARLLRCSDGGQLWARRFDEPRADVFAVQDSISERVASALQTRLARHAAQTDNRAAYEAYQNGRFHTLKLTSAEIHKGIRYYEQAIALDPGYARVFAGLGMPIEPSGSSAECRTPSRRRGKPRAGRSNSTVDSPKATPFLGSSRSGTTGTGPASKKEVRHALQLDPNSADAHLAYAHLLSNTGRHNEALAESRRASELDPGNPRTVGLEAHFLLYAGRTDEADARQEKAFELYSDGWMRHQWMALLSIDRGRYDEAVEHGRKVVEASPGNCNWHGHLRVTPSPNPVTRRRPARHWTRCSEARTAHTSGHTALLWYVPASATTIRRCSGSSAASNDAILG